MAAVQIIHCIACKESIMLEQFKLYKLRASALLSSSLNNGTLIISLHRHVRILICAQVQKNSFEQLIHLDYCTLVYHFYLCLVASRLCLVVRWSLGGELVGGEIPWW